MIPITATGCVPQYAAVSVTESKHMALNFEQTMSEKDFKRSLLDPGEDRLARELRGDSELDVEGFRLSLLGRLLSLFVGK